jgi:hypothetical protein
MKPFFITTMTLSLMLLACEKAPKPDAAPKNEAELITTVVLYFRDSLMSTQTFKWSDLDGPGGQDPLIDTIKLQALKAYDLSLDFLDESKTPTDSITTEIKAEANNHLIYFESPMSQLLIQTKDKDDNGLPLGLESQWQILGAGIGKVRIVLKHQVGIKNGDINLGETDTEVEFPIKFY